MKAKQHLVANTDGITGNRLQLGAHSTSPQQHHRGSAKGLFTQGVEGSGQSFELLPLCGQAASKQCIGRTIFVKLGVLGIGVSHGAGMPIAEVEAASLR